MMPVLRSLSQGRTKTPQAQIERNQMVHELIQGSALLSATRPDAPQALQDWSKVDRTVTETGYDLLSVCWHTGNGPVPWLGGCWPISPSSLLVFRRSRARTLTPTASPKRWRRFGWIW